MLRYLPLFGFACLAVAAVAVASLPKNSAVRHQPETDKFTRRDQGRALLVQEPVLLFHAPFSLN